MDIIETETLTRRFGRHEAVLGLDPLVREEFIRGVREVAAAGEWTGLVSSHDNEEVGRRGDRVVRRAAGIGARHEWRLAGGPTREGRQAFGETAASFALGSAAGIRWQRDFFDHRLRGDGGFEDKAEYIRMNPVRAGLVATATDWGFRSEG